MEISMQGVLSEKESGKAFKGKSRKVSKESRVGQELVNSEDLWMGGFSCSNAQGILKIKWQFRDLQSWGEQNEPMYPQTA